MMPTPSQWQAAVTANLKGETWPLEPPYNLPSVGITWSRASPMMRDLARAFLEAVVAGRRHREKEAA